MFSFFCVIDTNWIVDGRIACAPSKTTEASSVEVRGREPTAAPMLCVAGAVVAKFALSKAKATEEIAHRNTASAAPRATDRKRSAWCWGRSGELQSERRGQAGGEKRESVASPTTDNERLVEVHQLRNGTHQLRSNQQ